MLVPAQTPTRRREGVDGMNLPRMLYSEGKTKKEIVQFAGLNFSDAAQEGQASGMPEPVLPPVPLSDDPPAAGAGGGLYRAHGGDCVGQAGRSGWHQPDL
jgi:hypothetical protein